MAIGEFYSLTRGTENLELLSRFYAKYPEYADKTFLSVKGGMRLRGGVAPDSSYVLFQLCTPATHCFPYRLEFLRESVSNIQRALGPHKKMDLYEPARIDRTITIEQAIENLVVLLKEGYFAHIGLSECSAETLRRANAVRRALSECAEASIRLNLVSAGISCDGRRD